MAAAESAFMRWFNGPVGPKTTSFWGPFSNSLLVGAALWDMSHKDINDISTNMTCVLFGYSGLFMRFAYMVQPRNWFLFTVHGTNVLAQGTVLMKKFGSGAGKPVPAAIADKPAAAPASAAPAARESAPAATPMK